MLSNLTDFFLNKAISSGFLKSRIQAGIRALALGGAGWLVDHGLATNSETTIIVGAVTALVAAYLQDLDVRVVDGKIKIALRTPVPDTDVDTSTVTTVPSHVSEADEVEETRNLNIAQIHGSVVTDK